MKHTFFLFFFALLLINLHAQDTIYRNVKFRGGMMIHTGYLSNTRADQSISRFGYGIGGQLSYTIGDHFRLGTQGHASNLRYKGQEGSYKLGWGGLLLGYELRSRRLHPVVGVTIGGGHIRDVYFLETAEPDPDGTRTIVYRSYSSMLIAPSLSAEYTLKSNMTLLLKIDYILAVFSEHTEDFASGPRVYLGILFNRD